jgi:hypothetical protein
LSPSVQGWSPAVRGGAGPMLSAYREGGRGLHRGGPSLHRWGQPCAPGGDARPLTPLPLPTLPALAGGRRFVPNGAGGGLLWIVCYGGPVWSPAQEWSPAVQAQPSLGIRAQHWSGPPLHCRGSPSTPSSFPRTAGGHLTLDPTTAAFAPKGGVFSANGLRFAHRGGLRCKRPGRPEALFWSVSYPFSGQGCATRGAGGARPMLSTYREGCEGLLGLHRGGPPLHRWGQHCAPGGRPDP